MKTLVKRLQGELVLQLPQALVEEGNLREDVEVDVALQNGAVQLTVTPDRPSLEELLAGITEENRHPATDWGPPVGREVW